MLPVYHTDARFTFYRMFTLSHAGVNLITDHLEKATYLLDSGANPNLPDKSGWTVVHQCAWNGDLDLLQLVVQRGARVLVKNNQGQFPVQLASIRGHQAVIRYLEFQSCDLHSVCRFSIREAMGKRTYNRINELPVPPSVKLFLNYGNPYNGWQAVVVPPSPWSQEELHQGEISKSELRAFISENASDGFLEEHSDILHAGEHRVHEISHTVNSDGADSKGDSGGAKSEDVESLVHVFQTMYLWETFKTVDYEEPLARPPRYPLMKRSEDASEDTCTTI